MKKHTSRGVSLVIAAVLAMGMIGVGASVDSGEAQAQSRKKVYRKSPAKKKLKPQRRRAQVKKKPSNIERANAKLKMDRKLKELNDKVNGSFSVSFDDGQCKLEMRQSVTQSYNRINLLEVRGVSFNTQKKEGRLLCEGGKNCARTSNELDRGGTDRSSLSVTAKSSGDTKEVHQILHEMVDACYEYHGKTKPSSGGKA